MPLHPLRPLIFEPDPWAEAAVVHRQFRIRRKLEAERPCPFCGGAGQFALPVFVMLNRPPMLFRGICRACKGARFFKGVGQ